MNQLTSEFEVSRLKAEIYDLKARNEALERENTLLSLLGQEAATRVHETERVKRRVWA